MDRWGVVGLWAVVAVMEPEQLGPYRIVRTLGRGGMGAVYEGVHIETDEPAAIKVLSPLMSQEPDFRQRFEAEIETLKRLYHPNIVQLFGFGEQDGHLFYAMELVDGISLEEEVRQGRVFVWREVARLGVDTCRALRHAHDRGIIHRDIKPANLLLTREGRRIKLSDFGIARLFGNQRLTATGNVLGTAEYMSPEQADGRATGPRSDLYSLGCVLYFLLARRPPFHTGSFMETLQKHRSEPPEPVGRLVRDLPDEMDALVSHLLEKDPEKRVANATLVARRLESMLKALSRVRIAPERKAGVEGNAEFDVSVSGAHKRPSSPRQLSETRLVEPAAVASSPPAHEAAPAEEQPETLATEAFSIYDQQKTGKTDRATTGRFTVVEKEELDRPEPEPPAHSAIISLHTWILAGCLLAMGLGAWYLLRPPSADALYDKIDTMTSDRSIDSFQAAESSMQEFLTRYSGDLRAGRLRGYMREIELYRLEKKFERRAKGMASADRLLPIERAYVEAMNLAWLDPERGLAKLQALVDLHTDRTDPTGPDGQCLDLARRQMSRLRRQLDRSLPELQAGLDERLKRADEIRQTDPETARAILRGLVDLYQDKPSAAEAVAKARRALAEQDQRPMPPAQNARKGNGTK
jgi:serine/threonine-protein kinase